MIRTQILPLFLFAGSVFGADGYSQGRNQTVLREQAGSIRTIYHDVRTPFGSTLPALGMDDWMQIRLAYDNEHRFSEELDNPDLGRTHQADLLLRGYVLSRVVLEVETIGEASPVANDVDVSDLQARLAITVAKWRYAGIAVVGGWAGSMGQGKLPVIGHQGDFSRPGWILGTRFTGSLGFTVINLNIDGLWTPNGEQVFPEGWAVDEKVLTTGIKQEVNTARAQARLGISYRPCRWGRIGVEGLLRLDAIEFEEDRLNDRSTRVEAVAEFNPDLGISFTGHVGVQPDEWHDEQRGAIVWGAAMVIRF
jgi:hypothetical protein